MRQNSNSRIISQPSSKTKTNTCILNLLWKWQEVEEICVDVAWWWDLAEGQLWWPNGFFAGDNGAETEDDPDMIKPKQTKRSLKSNKAGGPALKKVRTEEWGRFSRNQRFNGDQVPFNLDQSARKVFVPAATAEHAQLSAPSGAVKTFGTLQMLMHHGEMSS